MPRDINGEVKNALRFTLEQIHRRAPNAKIVLARYPRLLPMAPLTCDLALFLAPEEQAWLNQMSAVMTTMESTLTQDLRKAGVPAWLANPQSRFEGREVCTPQEAIHAATWNYTPGETPSGKPSAQSFHPKLTGTDLYGQAVTETVRGLG